MGQVLLVNDTRRAGHHGSSATVGVILRELEGRGFAVRSHLEQRTDLRTIHARTYDGIVVNGEGTMHGGQKNAHLFAGLAETVSRQGVPIYLINTVFDERAPEIIAKVRHFTGIYCRETQSVRRLAAFGIGSELCPDLALGLAMDRPLAWTPGDDIVVLDTTVERKNRILHRFAANNGLAFLPIRTSPKLLNAADPCNISRILKFNARRYIGKLAPRSYTLNRYSEAVSSLHAFLHRLCDGTRVVVTGRFHGVCLCLKIGVPFLAIGSNTHKIEGMLQDAGLVDRMFDIEALDVEHIKQRAPWSATDEAKRAAYVGSAQAQIARMFDAMTDGMRAKA